MDMVVIYKANPDSVQQVLGYLRKEGFNPDVFENPSPISFHWAVRRTQRISIAVPREEAPGAVSVLRKWEEVNETEVRELTKSLSIPFLYATIITAVFALVLMFLGVLSDAGALLFLAWIVLFAVIANADKL